MTRVALSKFVGVSIYHHMIGKEFKKWRIMFKTPLVKFQH